MKPWITIFALIAALSTQAQVVDDIYGDKVDLTIVTPAQQDKASKQAQKEHQKLWHILP